MPKFILAINPRPLGDTYKFLDTTKEAIVQGISVMTEGPAVSHFVEVDQPDGTKKEFQVYVDGTTLDQVIASAGKYGNGVKVKANHRSGVEDVIGRLTNFQKVAKPDGTMQTKADFHLFKTSPVFEHTLHLLKTIADTIGFSAFFDGPVQRIGDKFFARCTELFSVDLVGEPSANPSGVFSKHVLEVDNPQKDEGAGTTTKTTTMPALPQEHLDAIRSACEAAMKPLHDRMAAMEASHAEMKKKFEGAAKPAPDGDGQAAPINPTGDAALYDRLTPKLKVLIGETVTAELQNTAKTLTALGLVPGTGPASSVGKEANPPGQQKKIEDMTFSEVLELEFSKTENQHKRDHEIITELARKYPGKHKAQLNQRDPETRALIGFARLPARKVPYVAPAA